MIKNVGKKLGRLVTGKKVPLGGALKIMALFDGLNRLTLSDSGRKLRKLQIEAILKVFEPRTRAIWTSVMFPAEILYPFDIYPLTLEVLAGLMSTVEISNYFIDSSDAKGVPPAMCSFHRMITGLATSDLLPSPTAVGSTSALCDGNAKTFAGAAREKNVPFLFVDVPFSETKSSVKYLKEQLVEATETLFKITGKKADDSVWAQQARMINQTITNHKELFKNLITDYKNIYRGFELANSAFSFHYLLGTQKLVEISRIMAHDAAEGTRQRRVYKKLRPGKKTKRLMWLHIVPQYDTPVWEIIDNGVNAKIVCDEYSAPYAAPYDENDFFASVAKRLINHPSNGGIERRIDHIIKIAKEFKIDGAIHYNSWGCHQAAGNIAILEKSLRKNGFDFLTLSGDAADKRNASTEQHRIRLEAFLEQ